MDAPESQAPTTSTLKRKSAAAEDETSMAISPKRIRFTPPNRRYFFVLPDSVMYYIARNPPSAEFYKKMIEVCKYFFWKNPIMFTDLLVNSNNELQGDFSDTQISLKNIPSRFWITGHFLISSDDHNTPLKENLISSFIPRIYRCEVHDLTLHNQKLSYDEFLFLTPHVGSVIFDNLTVWNPDGSEVAFEKLVADLPKVYSFDFTFKSEDKTVSPNTVKEILQLSHVRNCGEFRLFNVPQAFDDKAFFDHIKKSKSTLFQLHFDESISYGKIKRVGAMIDEIIATDGNYDYIPPWIEFPGMTDEQARRLSDICRENHFFF